jgi:hypothetical protein
MNPKLINLILVLCIVVLGVAYLFKGDDSRLNQQYRLLKLERDSLSLHNAMLEQRNDSIVKADIGHLKELDSAKLAGAVIIERTNTRNDEYKEIYNHLDTIGRSERYRYLSTILTSFDPNGQTLVK